MGRRKLDNTPIRRWIQSAKRRAERNGWEFDLDYDIVVPEFCPVLGIKLSPVRSRHSPASPSLDRFDNAKGYTKGNVRVISWRANKLKCDGSLEEFRKIVAYLENG